MEAISLALQDFHFGMESFGDGIVAGRPSHGASLVRPGMKRIAERDQLRKLGSAELVNGAEQARSYLLAVLTRVMVFRSK